MTAPPVDPCFTPEIASFRRYLRAENKSDNTVRIYTDAAERFARFLAAGTDDAGEAFGVESWEDVRGMHVQYWIVHLLDTRSDGYANNQYRAIQQFFKWWAAEEELPNPMTGMSPPLVPEQPVPVLRKEQLGKLLKACEGRDFISRRDKAMIYLFMDSGIRRAEMAALELGDLDLDLREARVHGKGRRDRFVAFGRKASVALDRYIRVRAKHRWADDSHLWLGKQGVLTSWGIQLMLRRRGREIGLDTLYPHMLRHSWAHYAKQNISEEELMRLAGWRSRQMVDRYAASTAAERAREAGKRRALGDQI